MRAFLLVVLALLSIPLHAAEKIPVEDFFAEPIIRSVQLSPNGKYLAFLTTLGTGRVGIATMELATGKIEPLVAAKDENIDSYFWKTDDFLVYSGDVGGNESQALRGFDLIKRKVIPLADSFREQAAWVASAGVIDILRDDPENILITGPSSTGSWSWGVYRLNVRTSSRTKVSGADEPDIQDLAADRTGELRARSRLRGDEAIHEVRATAKAPWKIVQVTPAVEAAAGATRWTALDFAADNRTLYVLNREGNGTAALHAYDTAKGELGPALFKSPDGEIDQLITSPDHTKLYGLAYTSDRTRYHWFDAAREALQKQIDSSLPPGTFNRVISATNDESRLVIAALSDRSPPVYYLLDLRKPALSLIGKQNIKLDPAKLGPMEPISYPARDGLVIHGYLTRPAGAVAGQPLPLIINPHGGPYGIRDDWGWSAEVQFLASRGYAVLQPNYRGSGGYGQAFMDAGRGEWGKKMQDDLTDAVRWAIAQGIADPKRVAIYGASYGGYAAMAGVTYTPDLYRCAINYVGAVDLTILAGFTRRGSRSSDLYHTQWVGNNADELRRLSPSYHVESIQVPTLHAYGENDPRVDIRHWKVLEAELKKHNKPYEAIREGEEGHGFSNESSRIRFYRRMETFLEQNMTPAGTVTIKPSEVIELPAKNR